MRVEYQTAQAVQHGFAAIHFNRMHKRCTVTDKNVSAGIHAAPRKLTRPGLGDSHVIAPFMIVQIRNHQSGMLFGCSDGRQIALKVLRIGNQIRTQSHLV